MAWLDEPIPSVLDIWCCPAMIIELGRGESLIFKSYCIIVVSCSYLECLDFYPAPYFCWLESRCPEMDQTLCNASIFMSRVDSPLCVLHSWHYNHLFSWLSALRSSRDPILRALRSLSCTRVQEARRIMPGEIIPMRVFGTLSGSESAFQLPRSRPQSIITRGHRFTLLHHRMSHSLTHKRAIFFVRLSVNRAYPIDISFLPGWRHLGITISALP